MQKIFEIIVKQLTEFFKIKHVVIFQLSPSGDELILTYSSDFSDESIQRLKELEVEGVLKRVFDAQISQIVNDISETEKSLSSLAVNQGLQSMIAVPVFSKRKLWGILTAFSQEKFRFKEEDGKIISLFGGQIGQLSEHFSQYMRDNLDEILVPILGSIEVLNFRYRDRDTIGVSEFLIAQNRLKKRILSYVAGLEQGSTEHITTEEKIKEEEIKLPSGNELNIEEVITIEGKKNSQPKAKRVLVIDDQPIVTDLLVSVLERMNYKSEVASCGRDGVEMFEKEGFDLVVTDLGMPDISGWEVSKTIKQKNPDVPVIIITGWGIDPDPDKMKDSKVDFIINKPFQLDQLEKIIKSLLEK
jgi:CheY-like chemotaxis protein